VKPSSSPTGTEHDADEDEDWSLEETVTITPLKTGKNAGLVSSDAPTSSAASGPHSPLPSATAQVAENAPLSSPASAIPSPMPVPFEDFGLDMADAAEAESEAASQPHRPAPGRQGWRKRVTGLLPVIGTPHEQTKTNIGTKSQPSWFKRLQEFFLGEQQHTTAAAATIETPMRVQPDQTYAIRIRLLGRDSPTIPVTPGESGFGRKTATSQGLSALIEGEIVYIEVRSVLYQSFAYIVQQAGVTIPAPGYAAEITIPMQALASGPSGRRDRLHIFFLDDKRRPLYEKPFVVEIFVSHLVQSGREGHNVLTIPL
jgi:hypothetical protein